MFIPANVKKLNISETGKWKKSGGFCYSWKSRWCRI